MAEPSSYIDSRSLAELLLRQAAPMRAYVQRHIPTHLRGEIQVEDVLQEAWTTAYTSIASFCPKGPDAFARWLMTIVATRLANAVRRVCQNKRGNGRLAAHADPGSALTALFERLAGPEKTPSRIVSTQDAARAVLRVLDSLSEDRRTAIRLHYLEGRSIQEVADTMNCSVAAVRSLLFHGCNQLRDLLGPVSKYLSGSSAPASRPS